MHYPSVPNLVSIIGEFGSGKSLLATELAFELSNRFHKRILSNISFDYEAAIRYCEYKKYHWLLSQPKLPIYYFSDSPFSILDFKNSIIIFDEAGALFHARNWAKVPPSFLTRLSQLRKLNIHLLLTFQYPEQIDKIFRAQCQMFALCFGLSKYDSKLSLPRLYSREIFYFDRKWFERYQNDMGFANHIIKPKLASILWRNELLPLDWLIGLGRSKWQYLFDIYSSAQEIAISSAFAQNPYLPISKVSSPVPYVSRAFNVRNVSSS